MTSNAWDFGTKPKAVPTDHASVSMLTTTEDGTPGAHVSGILCDQSIGDTADAQQYARALATYLGLGESDILTADSTSGGYPADKISRQSFTV